MPCLWKTARVNDPDPMAHETGPLGDDAGNNGASWMALAHFSDRANFQAGQAWWTSMAAYALSWPRHLRLEPWEKRYGCRHDRCPKTRPASLAEQAQVHAYVRARHVIQQGLESAESPKTWGVERCDALQCVLH